MRVALTVAAIALSVSLVVSVTSGYASIEAAVYKYLNQYMGSTDVEVVRPNDVSGGLTTSLLEKLRRDPMVAGADGRFEMALVPADIMGEPAAKRAAVIGLERPGDTRSDYLRFEKGGWFHASDGNYAVVDQTLAASLKLGIGDSFTLPVPGRKLQLKVVGIIHKPEVLASYMWTAYVPLRTLQEFAQSPGALSRIMIDLKTGADPTAFAGRWGPTLRGIDPSVKLRLARDTRRQMDKNLQGIHVLSYMGGTVSMLAATFIVFSALSMGVVERQRTLAMLRAVGAYRSQIAALVVLEGVLLAVGGALIGVPLGWLWIKLLALMFPSFFVAGVVLSGGGILYGSLGSIGAAIAASLLPAWSATRVSPLEAMAPLSSARAAGVPWRSALAGLLLICVDPFLLLGPLERLLALLGVASPHDAVRPLQFYGHFLMGLPCLMLGYFLLSPMFVWLIERFAGPLVAAMFALPSRILRQQLSTGIWRAAGTAAALMVGLAVLIVMQTEGHTLLNGWKLPDKFPDIFIFAPPLGGLDMRQQEMLTEVPGIKKGEVMPIGVASPEYGTSPWAIGLAAMMPNATMFIAVDPGLAFKMMELEFREGNAAQAAEQLKRGDAVVVTEEFRQLKGLHVGDKLTLKTNSGDVAFDIAGVVWSPGIDVMVSMFDMNRQFDQRTAASVFGSLADGRKYFGINQAFLFAANLDWGVQKEQLLKDVQRRLGEQGMRAGDVREIKHNIQKGFGRLLLLVSTVGFAAMAVASLGVTNTIMASIRSRRWQFGILRSIGVTRSQLLRLVVAEGLLLGMIGCGLGLAAGFEMSLDANALSSSITGYNPRLAIPWGMVGIGIGVVLFISLFASAWPAASVARTDPLALLQAGRASA